jgi:hypothetical protein
VVLSTDLSIRSPAYAAFFRCAIYTDSTGLVVGATSNLIGIYSLSATTGVYATAISTASLKVLA